MPVSSDCLESMDAGRWEDFETKDAKQARLHLIRHAQIHSFLCLSGKNLAFWMAAGSSEAQR